MSIRKIKDKVTFRRYIKRHWGRKTKRNLVYKSNEKREIWSIDEAKQEKLISESLIKRKSEILSIRKIKEMISRTRELVYKMQ